MICSENINNHYNLVIFYIKSSKKTTQVFQSTGESIFVPQTFEPASMKKSVGNPWLTDAPRKIQELGWIKKV